MLDPVSKQGRMVTGITTMPVSKSSLQESQGSITLGPRGRKFIAKQPPEPSDHRDVKGEVAET